MNTTLSNEELAERIAILRRFRTLLEQQRSKFQQYLQVLEQQEQKISIQDADAIIAHSELEAQIVEGLGSLQKVIVPMQELCQNTNAASFNPKDAVPISHLQTDLAKLQSQVLAQNQRNRALLKNHISQLKTQMVTIKNPYRTARSVYAEHEPVGTLVSCNA